ncbi:NACHT domain-containing protein [Streptomyces sp. NPDC001157]
MSVEEAVRMLATGRMELVAAVDTLMSPPRGRRSGRTQNEPGILHDLLRHFPERVRAAHGVERAALIQAARVVLVAAAVVQDTPSREEATRRIRSLAAGMHMAYASPARTLPHYFPAEAVPHVIRDYVRLATPLAASCPEFALVTDLPNVTLGDTLDSPAATALAGLGDLLSEFAVRDDEFSVTDRSQLRRPIAELDSHGPQAPSLAEGYINPRFRLADRYGSSHDGLAADKWWKLQPSHDGMERFLAAHFIGLPALLTPLVVLGDPGAGKSLLTKLLSARLPTREFRLLRVELRHVPAEADLQSQLEHALREEKGRQVHWPDWSAQESGPVPVVLLDGFDELLQAGAQRLGSAGHWNYLQGIEAFQQREARLGRPLIVIVTSRTVVADRADIPRSSPVVRLEPFEEPELKRWLAIWNATNAGYFERHRVQPLALEGILSHLELASQPLLLLMLALYDAVDNKLHRSCDQGISRTQLYDRMLEEFIRRQVDKDRPLPPDKAAVAVEQELYSLSVIALGMFHRGAQSIGSEEADRDLQALGASAPGDTEKGSGLLFGRFFFVHEAQAVVSEERLRSYEFMHATFGEHLAARLIEKTLRGIADIVAAGLRTTPDDGELYALLSFAPLTDRAQLLQNLHDMVAAWPDQARTGLVPTLIDLFRAAAWEPEHRTAVPHTPIRLTRTYRNAVYEANLVLIVVLMADEVSASELIEPDSDAVDGWRRHALGWQGQLSSASWTALTSALVAEHCWHATLTDTGERRTDLRISTRRTPLVHHELNWSLRNSPPRAPKPLAGNLEDRLSDTGLPDLIRRVSFVGDQDIELLLHVCYPVLLQLPSTISLFSVDSNRRIQSAAQSLVALLTRDVYAPTVLPDLYRECLEHIMMLARQERGPYIEAVLRHLVHDAPAMSDEVLASALSKLGEAFLDGEVSLTRAMEQPLLDCIRHALARGSRLLADPVDSLRGAFVRDTDPGNSRHTSLHHLLLMTHLSDSTRTWQWSASSTWRGQAAARSFDGLLSEVDLSAVAVTHPSAVIDLLRLAAELGLDTWLSEHAAQLLGALPSTAFGLLRPSDLAHLRTALPEGAYATEFEEMERVWRDPNPSSP